jgi:hypothetical protein
VPAVSTGVLAPVATSTTSRSPATSQRSLHTALTTATRLPSGEPLGQPSCPGRTHSSRCCPVRRSISVSTASYQLSSSGDGELMVAIWSGPHQQASQQLHPSGETSVRPPEPTSYTQRLRQAASVTPDSTRGSHAGRSASSTVRMVTPEPWPPERSAPSPATPSRIREPSGDQCRYSIVPGTAGAATGRPPVARHSWNTPGRAWSDNAASVAPSGENRAPRAEPPRLGRARSCPSSTAYSAVLGRPSSSS